MNVLVTGGAGYVGSYLVGVLRRAGRCWSPLCAPSAPPLPSWG